MERGWIKIYRKIEAWGRFDSPNTILVFMWLILNANYRDTIWHERTIKRGQLVTSINSIREKTKLTIPQIRTALNHLKRADTITVEGTSRYSIITVINYCIYQDADTRNYKRKKPYKGIQRAGKNQVKDTYKQQTENKQTTINKEKEKINNLNKKENILRNTTTFGLQPMSEILRTLKAKSGANV